MELFGIETGVATGVERRMGKFETANAGTLYLDEICDVSLAAQAKPWLSCAERPTEDHLNPVIRSGEPLIDTNAEPQAIGNARHASLSAAGEVLERRMIEDALPYHGTKQKQAKTLALSRQGLIKKLKRLGNGANSTS